MKYCRQTTLALIGEKGQEELAKKRVAIIGIGAHGSQTATMLVRLGIGKLIIFDNDEIRADNLHRQSLYYESDIGKSKVETAIGNLSNMNSETEVVGYDELLDETNIDKIKDCDIIIDCTDELPVRMLINEFALDNAIPWIYTAAIRTYGRLYVTVPNDDRACFRCFTKSEKTIEKCKTAGVINTITFAIPSMAATQAVRYLLKGEYEKDLIIFDIWDNGFERIKVRRDTKCPHCSTKSKLVE